MTIKRNYPPQVYGIEQVEYIEPHHYTLKNGAELFTLKSGDQEVVKIDFTFKAGSWFGQSRLDSTMVAAMLQEGTTQHKASEIANTFDFYGAQFSSNASYDYNYISLLSLKKHLPQLLPLMAEILSDATFPEEEFDIVRNKRKQRAIVDAGKVSMMAQRGFLINLFGPGHPYAPVPSPDAYDTIILDDVKNHYRQLYRPDRMTIVASGFVDQEVITQIEENFSFSWGNTSGIIDTIPPELPSSETTLFIEKQGANQNAVALGKIFPVQNHPDFPGLKLLSTILGGYFGSRLMTNLREEKGYTYSIQASPITFVHHGVFLIFAEVKTEKTDETIKEIFIEMDKLRNELITEKELIPVQNYLLGRILEDFDGSFARAQTFESLREMNLDFEYYKTFIHTIKHTTPEQIRDLAIKYLDPLSFQTVVAGMQSNNH